MPLAVLQQEHILRNSLLTSRWAVSKKNFKEIAEVSVVGTKYSPSHCITHCFDVGCSLSGNTFHFVRDITG